MQTKQEAAENLREAMKTLGGEAAAVIVQALGGAPKPERERVRSSEPLTIYAQKDIYGPIGKDGAMVLVHPQGFAQQVPPVDAREITRSGLYGYQDPGPASSAAPVRSQPVPSQFAGGTGVDPTGSPLPSNAPSSFAAHAPAQQASIPAPASTIPFALTSLPGVNAKLARALEDAKGEDGASLNLATLEGFRAVKVETLAQVPGVGQKMAEIMKQHVTDHYPVTGTN